MCQFLSAIVTRNGAVLHNPATDSHSDLIAWFKLKEGAASQNFVRVEFTPKARAFADVDSYTLRVDETFTPTWFDGERRADVVKILTRIVKGMIVTDQRAILLGGTWILGNGCRAAVARRVRIIAMMDNASVASMYGSSTVKSMYDSSTVEIMYGSSTVKSMYDSSTVKSMYDSSTVKSMSDSSTVKSMYDSSTVKSMSDSSTVAKVGRCASAPKKAE